MEPVYCPNGHPNRPGTRLCIVCRALISAPPPAAAAEPAPRPAAPRPAVPPPAAAPIAPPPAAPTDVPPKAAPPAKPPSRRWGFWLLLLIPLLALAAIALIWPLFFPEGSRGTSATMPSTIVADAPAVLITPPTAAPAPTDAPATAPDATETAAPSATNAPAGTETPDGTETPTAVPTITPLATVIGVVITPTFAFGRDTNFIQNGDFADDWANGWTLEPLGDEGVVDVRPDPNDAANQIVHLSRTGSGMTRIGQRVVLTFPVEGLVFRAGFRLTGEIDGAAEGRSALILRYVDAAGEPLGASVWLDGTTGSTDLWGEEPLPELGPNVAVHLVDDDWQELELRLEQEFDRELSGIDPIDVRQITIFLAALGSDACAPAGCEATVEVANLSLTAEAP